jgi:hypothetical protein
MKNAETGPKASDNAIISWLLLLPVRELPLLPGLLLLQEQHP